MLVRSSRDAEGWVRLGRRWGLAELAVVLTMQVLGGDPQSAYLLGLCGLGYALGLAWSRARASAPEPIAADRKPASPRLTSLRDGMAVVTAKHRGRTAYIDRMRPQDILSPVPAGLFCKPGCPILKRCSRHKSAIGPSRHFQPISGANC